uniref:Uncharacterized protein n=1 Tax=Anguilla anguilla TaxID=7936 RepID=A0A0E9XRV9_ANGAN
MFLQDRESVVKGFIFTVFCHKVLIVKEPNGKKKLTKNLRIYGWGFHKQINKKQFSLCPDKKKKGYLYKIKNKKH